MNLDLLVRYLLRALCSISITTFLQKHQLLTPFPPFLIPISTAMTAPTTTSRKNFRRSKSKRLLVIIIVALLLLSLIGVVLFFTLRHKISDSHSPKSSSSSKVPVAAIQLACQATQHPETCQTSLYQSNIVPPNPTPVQIIQSALWVSSQNLSIAQSMLKSLLASAAGNQNITNVAKSCLEILGFSQYRSSVSNNTLPFGKSKNVRAWMSAAVAYQYDCYGGLGYHGGNSQEINKTRAFLEDLITLSSNALSMIVSYDLFGNETRSWRPPKTERDGFWEDPKLGGGIGFRSEFPSNLTVDATVCKNVSSGCYGTVQEAVNAAPNATERRFVIHIKEGVYEEIVRIPFEKKNVVFLGDGMGKTIITGSLSVAQPGVTTYESATVGKFKPFPCFLSSSLDWYLWCQTGPKFAKLCTLFYKSTRLLSYFKASSTRFCW